MQPRQHATAQDTLRAAWQKRGLLARTLLPLAWLHAALAGLHRGLYRLRWLRQHQLPVPVVVIGNVVAGGAGKTPTALAVVRHLGDRGWRPGVLSRGYGRRDHGVHLVSVHSDPLTVGDEPLLLHRKSGVPVAVAAQRSRAGQALLAAHPDVDVLVCDDGLQHLALARDLEICVFDQRGTGNGWLLPAGPLRERWPRAVDLVLLTEPLARPLPRGDAGPVSIHQASRQLAPYACNARGQRVALGELNDQAVTAVAAIARPEAFFAMLQESGLALAQAIALPDHFDFAREEDWMRSADVLVCTEKDAVKLRRHRPDALAVPLQLQVPPSFFAELDRRLAQVTRAG